MVNSPILNSFANILEEPFARVSGSISRRLKFDRIKMMDRVPASGANAPASSVAIAEQQARLKEVLASLEGNLALLDDLRLTLAAALLDNAIAELKRQVTD